MKKIISAVLAWVLIAVLVLPMAAPVLADEGSGNVTILFTHDLHSHLLPAKDEGGGQYGGYARLMTVINEQKAKYPNAILVDGGDFSMGSLFQTAFTTSAIELRMMGAMGFDATTLGNHEFDYLPSGLAAMLNTAVASGDKLPAIVEGNYLPPTEEQDGYGADAEALWKAFENYGVKDYVILERGGIYYVIFGIFGYDSDDCAPNSGAILMDPAETAQRIVDQATAECVEKYGVEPMVVCLSHSGTSGGQGEDYELAQKVEGIHVIVSGHTHTTLQEPVQVGDTYIVSAGEYGRYLGVVNLDYSTDGNARLVSYELIPVDETVEEDPAIAEMVEGFKQAVNDDYLAQYGVTFDMVLTQNPYQFDTVDQVYATLHESTLGNVFSDAYKWAVEQATGLKVDIALTAAGVIRESLPVGAITVSDVFNAASLGVGTEGELIAVYITGKDLKNALEVDASVQALMPSAQLFFSGIEYSVNTNRMIFNKVDYARLRRADGSLEKIENNRLYLVVTGMYAGQMLGSVKESSYGLLNITPRDMDGNPIATEDLKDHVVIDSLGRPLKEWYAISSYLGSMYGKMDAKYAGPDGRKVVYSSLNPIKLLRNANVFTLIVVAVILIVAGLITLIIWLVVRAIRRKKGIQSPKKDEKKDSKPTPKKHNGNNKKKKK